MLLVRRSRILGPLAGLVLAVALACGGGSSPTTPATPSSTASATTTVPPTPTTVLPQGSCPLGMGDISASCQRTSAALLPAVDAAINKLAAENPSIFNFNRTAGPGQYEVLNSEAYFQGVVKNLQGAGLCANYDGKEIQVKSSNDFSEQYDILVSTGTVRRGDGSYRNTCTPAIFPLNPNELIDAVRVAYYGIKCNDGRVPPGNGLGQLPVGCIGFLTATPKTKENKDVDHRVFGNDVTWNLVDGGEFVGIEDVADQPFNKNLFGKAPGEFTYCATVKGVKGCLFGRVIP